VTKRIRLNITELFYFDFDIPLRRNYSNISTGNAVVNMANAMYTETLNLHKHFDALKPDKQNKFNNEFPGRQEKKTRRLTGVDLHVIVQYKNISLYVAPEFHSRALEDSGILLNLDLGLHLN